MATLAPALVTLRDEINRRWPGRDKTSDGWIGDTAHAARKSDHNPNAKDVVCAIDVDEDGIDCAWLAEHVRQLGAAGDPRVGYVIYEGRIAGPKSRGWAWRDYDGANPHDHHAHISANQDAAAYGRTDSWGVLTAAVAPVQRKPATRPCPGITRPGDGMRPKAPSAVTKAFQELLVAGAFLAARPGPDGRHGPGTSAAIVAVERAHGLAVDAGVGGPDVWAVLTGAR